MNKAELRKQALLERAALSEGQYESGSRAICEHFFFAFDLSFIRVVHLFLPLTSRKEPDIWPLIDRIRREFPHIRIAIPRISGDQLKSFFFEGLHQLKKNSLGIDEPSQGVEVPIEKIDLILIPLLLADHNGNRLGYGKGYYDRFLKNCRPEALRVGISLLKPINQIPTDSHDISLTHLITPEGVIRFK